MKHVRECKRKEERDKHQKGKIIWRIPHAIYAYVLVNINTEKKKNRQSRTNQLADRQGLTGTRWTSINRDECLRAGLARINRDRWLRADRDKWVNIKRDRLAKAERDKMVKGRQGWTVKLIGTDEQGLTRMDKQRLTRIDGWVSINRDGQARTEQVRVDMNKWSRADREEQTSNILQE